MRFLPTCAAVVACTLICSASVQASNLSPSAQVATNYPDVCPALSDANMQRLEEAARKAGLYAFECPTKDTPFVRVEAVRKVLKRNDELAAVIVGTLEIKPQGIRFEPDLKAGASFNTCPLPALVAKYDKTLAVYRKHHSESYVTPPNAGVECIQLPGAAPQVQGWYMAPHK